MPHYGIVAGRWYNAGMSRRKLTKTLPTAPYCMMGGKDQVVSGLVLAWALECVAAVIRSI